MTWNFKTQIWSWVWIILEKSSLIYTHLHTDHHAQIKKVKGYDPHKDPVEDDKGFEIGTRQRA